jgi:hypothetical protein
MADDRKKPAGNTLTERRLYSVIVLIANLFFPPISPNDVGKFVTPGMVTVSAEHENSETTYS